MEKENIEKIMEEYRSEAEKIENTDKEKNIETNRKKLHIKRLNDELEGINPISEKSLYEEYQKQIKEAENELEDFIRETRTPDEIYNDKKEKEIKIIDNKDNAIKNLTQANIKIEKEIKNVELEYQIISNKISNFEYIYDENHIPTNSNELKEMWNNREKIAQRRDDLKETKIKCEEYLNELKQPSKEVETINSILNETYDKKDENTEKTDNDNVNVEIEQKIEEKSNNEKVEEKQNDEKVVTENKKTIEKTPIQIVENAMNKATDPSEIDALNAIKEDAIREEKNKQINKISENKRVQQVSEEYKRKIDDIKINAKKSEMSYKINNKQERPIDLKNGYGEFSENIIKKALKEVYSEKELNEDDEKIFKKYEYADPNIVKLLKNNKAQLEEYADALNGMIDKKKMSFDIQYDIRGLSKSQMTVEAQKDLEENAFRHRNIAKIKSNIFQKIKFAFNGLLEKARKVKALPAADLIKTAPLKEDDNINKENNNKIEKTMDTKLEMENNNVFSFLEDYKVNNSNNDIEKNAVENLSEKSNYRQPNENDLSK